MHKVWRPTYFDSSVLRAGAERTVLMTWSAGQRQYLHGRNGTRTDPLRSFEPRPKLLRIGGLHPPPLVRPAGGGDGLLAFRLRRFDLGRRSPVRVRPRGLRLVR